ncbi:MAG: transcription-repair coupling factor, partial [Gammaproteobacteria bacterium]
MAEPRPLTVTPPLPTSEQPHITWGRLYGCTRGLAIARAAAAASGLSVVVAADTHSARQLEAELEFFNPAQAGRVLIFPDWETLPYDVFSPHEDIVSQRLETLYNLPALGSGVLIVPVTTLMQRLAPRSFLDQNSLMLAQGQRLERESMRHRMEDAGYSYVSQ